MWLTKAIIRLKSCDYGAAIEKIEMAVVFADGFQKASNAATEGNAQVPNNHDISRFYSALKHVILFATAGHVSLCLAG